LSCALVMPAPLPGNVASCSSRSPRALTARPPVIPATTAAAPVPASAIHAGMLVFGSGGRRRRRGRGRRSTVVAELHELERHARLLEGRDLDHPRHRDVALRAGGELVATGVDDHRRGERRLPDREIVDRDLRARHAGGDLELADLLLQLVDRRSARPCGALGAPRPALAQVALEGGEGRGVVAQLARGLAEVVEDAVVGGELVGALELDHGRGEIAVLVEADAGAEMLAGLVALGRGRALAVSALPRAPRCASPSSAARSRSAHRHVALLSSSCRGCPRRSREACLVPVLACPAGDRSGGPKARWAQPTPLVDGLAAAAQAGLERDGEHHVLLVAHHRRLFGEAGAPRRRGVCIEPSRGTCAMNGLSEQRASRRAWPRHQAGRR
jgi:hypothetical protein